MIITISGTPGSGKSTVGKRLAKKLGYRYYSIGAMRRAMAQERGMTLQEFNVLGETKPFTDLEIDRWQAKLGRQQDNLVVEGRTSFHFIPHSVKIFLSVDLTEAARRIFHDPAHVRRFEASHRYSTVKDLAHGLSNRMASDARRYRKYYRLNIFLPKHYDLVIDSTKKDPAEILQHILKFLANPVRGEGVLRKISKAGSVSGKEISQPGHFASNGAKVKQKSDVVDKQGTSTRFSHRRSKKKLPKKKFSNKARIG